MKRSLAAVVGLVLWSGAHANAHRLDEYLQATIFQVEKDRIQAQMYLTPGVAVFPAVLSQIDLNGDGAISGTEQKSYAERVLHDLSLRMDGKPLSLELLSTRFADIGEMREGRGDIEIEFTAKVPGGWRGRRLWFENHHETAISAYLVNCLVPRDPRIRITAQKRSYQQSSYELDYVEDRMGREPVSERWLGIAILVLLGTVLLSVRVWRERDRTA